MALVQGLSTLASPWHSNFSLAIIFRILVELGFSTHAMCWHLQEDGRHQRRRRAPMSAPRLPRSVTAASRAVTAPPWVHPFKITQHSAGRPSRTKMANVPSFRVHPISFTSRFGCDQATLGGQRHLVSDIQACDLCILLRAK